MPKFVIFGATGQAGRAFCKYLDTKQATAIGVSRNPTKATPFKNVKWVKADPYQRNTYMKHLKGCDAVIGLLGSEEKKNVTVYTKAYPEIMLAMQQSKVFRLIVVTADHDHPDQPFIFKHIIKPVFLENVFKDMMKFEGFLIHYKGPIKYTNLRPSKFVQGKRKPYKLVESYSKASNGWDFEIHVQSLCEAIYQLFEKQLYINKFVDVGHFQVKEQ